MLGRGFDLYGFARPLLFRLDAEVAHEIGLGGLDALHAIGLSAGGPRTGAAVECFGLRFPNRLGVAAGLDKNADHVDALGALGFGHVEVGTVTPRPQPGNPKPRLFRIPEVGAVVNRMGFNNRGVDHLVERIARRRYRGICGVNIGKNFDTPLERAHEDYRACFEAVYSHADYVTVNVSSPNTVGLRELQKSEGLSAVLDALLERREGLAAETKRRVPLLVKIAPDLESLAIRELARLVVGLGIDGIVATNTTLSREGLPAVPEREEAGGLSGAPLRARARAVVAELREAVGDELPIVGVGGIASGEDAVAMRAAGATLVQIYTGFIYRGPSLVDEVLDALDALDGAQADGRGAPLDDTGDA